MTKTTKKIQYKEGRKCSECSQPAYICKAQGYCAYSKYAYEMIRRQTAASVTACEM